MQVPIMQTSPSAKNTQTRSIISKGNLQMITPDLTPRPYANQLEIWKPVVGYENWYEVSNLGHIKRIKQSFGTRIGRQLKPYKDVYGYLIVCLCKDRAQKVHKLHRLVALAFLGNPPTPTHQVNHINSDRADARLENLEWVTPSENTKHSFAVGFSDNKGEKHPGAKLTWANVREIRLLHSQGVKRVDIARMFNIRTSNVSFIVKNQTWKE